MTQIADWKTQHNSAEGWGKFKDETYVFKADAGADEREEGKKLECHAVSCDEITFNRFTQRAY